MNTLFKLRKTMVLCNLLPFKYILYSALLSDVVPHVEGDVKNAVCNFTETDVYDLFSEWDDADDSRSELVNALNELADEGLLYFGDEGLIYLGEFRGRKFFPFERKTSLYDVAVEQVKEAIRTYRKGKSAICKSRGLYLHEQITEMLDKEISNLSPGDFTTLHGYLYELYTGGQIYNIRNKIEYYQTTNMLKAFDRPTLFAVLTEAVLNYDTYRTKGLPTLVNVNYIKDEVLAKLMGVSSAGSKEYMRKEIKTTGGFE